MSTPASAAPSSSRLGSLLAASLFGPLALQVMPPFFFARGGRPDMARHWETSGTLALLGFAVSLAFFYVNLQARRRLRAAGSGPSLRNAGALGASLWLLLHYGGMAAGPLSGAFQSAGLNPETTSFVIGLLFVLTQTLVSAATRWKSFPRSLAATHVAVALSCAILLAWYAFHSGLLFSAASAPAAAPPA